MDLFNYLGDKFSAIGQTILEVLPTSPIVYLEANDEIRQVLAWVNWFIPIYSMISTLEAWLMCILFYYIYQVALRWFKIIE